MKRPALAIAAAVLSYGFGDPAYFANRKGNDLYAKGEYKEALESYKLAGTLDPRSREIDFNLGEAFYKLGNYGESAKSFERAAESKDPALKKSAVAGQGAAFYKAGDHALQTGRADMAVGLLEKSVAGFKSAILADPADGNVKKGLELALAKLDEARKKANMNQSPKDQDDKDNSAKDDSEKKDNQSGQQQRPQEQAKDQQDGKSGDSGHPEEKDKGKKDQGNGDEKDGKDGAEGMTGEQASQVLSAVAADEKNLRNKIRNRMMKETPRQGKDW
ncbi:MAG: tetratricopeptide repeat protein [Nitrospinae bacterium]|nr:tetratricopeptide repeat protein [Nitrospinota bacterium]